MSRRFFSGKTLQAAILSAASYYEVDADELAYKPLEKKQGRLRTTDKVVIAVDPKCPTKPAEAPAEEPVAQAAATEASPEADGEPARAAESAEADEPSAEADEPADDDGADDESPEDEADEADEDDADVDESDEEDSDGDGEDADEEAGEEDGEEDGQEDGGEDDDEAMGWYDGGAEPAEDDPYAREDDIDGNRLEGPPPHLQSHRGPAAAGGRGGRGGRGRGGGRGAQGQGKGQGRSRGGRGRGRSQAAQPAQARGGDPAPKRAADQREDSKPRSGRGRRRRGGPADRGPKAGSPADHSPADRSKADRSKAGRGAAERGLVDLPVEPRPMAERLKPAEGELADAAVQAVEIIAQLTEVEMTAQVFEGDDRLEIDLASPQGELLTAEDGELLVAIEHLLPRVMRGFGGETAAVRVDCENFQEIREEKLRSFAQQVAGEVRRSGRSRSLTPLSPSDRRIVHMAIATEPGVESESEGRGFLKRVRVSAS